MKSRQTWVLAILSIATIALLAGDVLAQGGRAPRAPRGERQLRDPGETRLDRMAARLDLTQEQRVAIEAIQTAARGNNLELRKQIERARHELRGEMLKDNPDERSVVQLTERIGKLRTELQVNRAKTRLAVRAQLTPEQRDKMLLMRGSDRRGGRGAGSWCCGGEGPSGGPRHGRSEHRRGGPRDASGGL